MDSEYTIRKQMKRAEETPNRNVKLKRYLEAQMLAEKAGLSRLVSECEARIKEAEARDVKNRAARAEVYEMAAEQYKSACNSRRAAFCLAQAYKVRGIAAAHETRYGDARQYLIASKRELESQNWDTNWTEAAILENDANELFHTTYRQAQTDAVQVQYGAIAELFEKASRLYATENEWQDLEQSKWSAGWALICKYYSNPKKNSWNNVMSSLPENLLRCAEASRSERSVIRGMILKPNDFQVKVILNLIRNKDMSAEENSELVGRLRTDIAKWEGQDLEFMLELPEQVRELEKEIAAFGTSNAATIYLGVDDHRNVVGVNGISSLEDGTGKDEYNKRIQGISRGIDPPIRVNVAFLDYEGRVVVRIDVPKGAEPIYYVRGVPYLRDITASRRATPVEVKEILHK